MLPNHNLFTLSEQPPQDMAGLLGTFRNGKPPPVLRKRAGELLGVILGAVKDAEGDAKAVEVDAAMKPAEVASEVAEEHVILTQEDQKGAQEARLWSHRKLLFLREPPTKLMCAFCSSSRWCRISLGTLWIHDGNAQGWRPYQDFRGTNKCFVCQVICKSCMSSSGSECLRNGKVQSAPAQIGTSSFQDVLNKIHRSLVIAPSAPMVHNS